MLLWNNATVAKVANSTLKFHCAKECPCGVPVIPVPDEWLEVMVSGSFKVWHIIFIVIALVVSLIVVYCCFHRCRIPRTKQEIEADLMRTNLAKKFNECMQELPSEPTTFIEALKKVQELEEKAEKEAVKVGQDDDVLQEPGAQKRLVWLKVSKGEAGTKAATNLGRNSCDSAGTRMAPIDSEVRGRALEPTATSIANATIAAPEKSARLRPTASRFAERERTRDLVGQLEGGSMERATSQPEAPTTKSSGALVRANKITEKRRRHKPNLARKPMPHQAGKLKVAQ